MTTLLERLRVAPTVTLSIGATDIATARTIRTMMIERAEAADVLAVALQAIRAGIAFIEGFEDDELQEGMGDLLGRMRAALVIAGETP